jgi:heme o synthase
VPMLPNVKGARTTRRHIFGYALLLAPLGVLPVVTGLGGVVFGAVSVLMGAGFVVLAARVLASRAGDEVAENNPSLYAVVSLGNRHARNLFAFSILYLFSLFAALLIEVSFLGGGA